MVGFELWLGTATVTSSIRPDPGIIRECVWQPISELGVPVFAFGAPWFRLLEDGLRVVDRLGTGGRPIQPRYPVAPCRFSRARTALLSSPCARPQQSKGLKQL